MLPSKLQCTLTASVPAHAWGSVTSLYRATNWKLTKYFHRALPVFHFVFVAVNKTLRLTGSCGFLQISRWWVNLARSCYFESINMQIVCANILFTGSMHKCISFIVDNDDVAMRTHWPVFNETNTLNTTKWSIHIERKIYE